MRWVVIAALVLALLLCSACSTTSCPSDYHGKPKSPPCTIVKVNVN